MRVVFVHGACVKDGAWWWKPTAELPAQKGITSEAPVLPSCGEAGESATAQGPGLSDDVSSVRAVLESTDEPTIVVAHSYGGIVVAEAAAGLSNIHHMLLNASYLPEVGESLSSFGGESPAPFLAIDMEVGTFTVKSDALADTFLQDCSADIQSQALEKTALQSLSVLGQPVQSAAWKASPTTYIVCTQDQGTRVDKQREFASKAHHLVEMASGHHPFISQPAVVSDLIMSL